MKKSLAWRLVAGVGCSGEKHAEKAAPTVDPYAEALRNGPRPGYKPGSGPQAEEPAGPRGFRVEHEIGVLDQYAVEDAIAVRWPQITRCYTRAGAAQKYAGGNVRVRFVVSATGAVDDVFVIESPLGNFEVERCVVDEGKQVRMPRPGGGAGTTFDYHVQFNSTREIDVIDWPADRFRTELAMLTPQLGDCGKVGEGPIDATFYIMPRGTSVGSAGLASEQAIDATAAGCVVEKIRGWKPPPVPAAAVARVRMIVPPPGTVVAPPPAPARSKRGHARARRQR